MTEPEPGSGHGRQKRLAAIVVAAGTVIGLLTGGTEFFDWVSGKVNPPDPPPPAVVDARITELSLRSTRDRLADYLAEIRPQRATTQGDCVARNPAGAPLDPRQAAERGFVFLARVEITGNLGRCFPLRWTVIDTRTDTRIDDDLYSQVSVWLSPRGILQGRTWPIWVPYPPRAGTYRLRATLAEEDGQPLDELTSEPFAFRGDPDA